MATPDLYGSADPYQRVPRSPKRQGNDGNSDQDRCRSPTVDQNNSLPPPHTLPFPPPQSHSSRGSCKERINGVCLSPTAKHQKKHPPDLKQNKPDSSFSRSRSSSISSLENVSSEAIQCLYFVDSYTRKADSLTCPCLWVGTSLGSILVIILNLPPPGDLRSTQPVIVSPSGTIFTMKGAIMAMSFLDCNGALIHYLFESWKDANKESKDKEKADSPALPKQRISPTSAEVIDRQFAVVCSEQQARVITLPSQTCIYKIKISDNAFVIKADIVSVKDSVCLTCYLSNGHIMVFSLPSLKCLMDVEYLPPTEVRISRTFCFSNNGHALYLCSPTEIQKITFSAEICENLQEMLGDLFLPCETPEPPKQGFFKGLFGGGTHSLDREQLFGESSGKASRSLAKHIPGTAGLEHLKGQATGVAADVQRTRMALVERGERLGELEERTGQMMMQAESFSQAANQIMQKYRDKKWYQF